MSAVERLDRYQRDHSWLGAPIAVVYKFFEDRGPYLAALVTYYGFVSLFPLLLVLSSALAFFLEHNPHLRNAVVTSALRNFPIIGPQLRENVGSFHGSGLALAIGITITLYGGMGVMQAAQAAFNQIYSVPRNEQPNPLTSRLRSLGLLLLLGGGVLVSTGVATVIGPSSKVLPNLGTPLRAVGFVIMFAMNLLVFTGAFQLLTARTLRFRQVVRGGVLAGLSWLALQTAGTSLARNELQHASSVYGAFGLVLATLAWLYAQALVIMLCAEINVVTSRRLWPRSLLTPFTDDVELTEADKRVYHLHAQTQRFKGFEAVRTEFSAGPVRADPADAD